MSGSESKKRTSYLKYLPAVYREDPDSRDFLERYLSIFEDVLSRLESQIEDMPKLFDAQETPSKFLPWLSTWVGAVKDEDWPEEKWRQFLSRAVQLYKKRGTKAELNELIEIYTGRKPFAIVEPALFKGDNKEALDRLFGDKYSFCVVLWPNQVKTERDWKVIKRIIQSEKPAHTHGDIAVVTRTKS
jgi:phage tail-like protein